MDAATPTTRLARVHGCLGPLSPPSAAPAVNPRSNFGTDLGACTSRAATATATPPPSDVLDQREILAALRAVRKGDFTVRLPSDRTGIAGEIAEAFNDIVELNDRTAAELRRIAGVVGRDGRIAQRASISSASGGWAGYIDAVNALVTDLTQPTAEMSRVIGAVREATCRSG